MTLEASLLLFAQPLAIAHRYFLEEGRKLSVDPTQPLRQVPARLSPPLYSTQLPWSIWVPSSCDKHRTRVSDFPSSAGLSGDTLGWPQPQGPGI